MIADYLSRSSLLAEFTARRAELARVNKNLTSKTSQAFLAKRAISPEQVQEFITILDTAIKSINDDKFHPPGSAFIPSSPLVCALQSGMTRNATASEAGRLEPNRQPVPKAIAGAGRRAVGAAAAAAVVDTSAPHRLATGAKAKMMAVGGFIEGDDIYYALKGIKAKASGLMNNPRPFNPNPAKPATTDKPLSLYIFGDWGTGLLLARKVTQSIYKQLRQEEASTQAHVIHLGDVYYIGEKEEYENYMLHEDCWPIISPEEIKAIGSWSLNGNHDRYSGGYGYFDTLLKDDRFIRWHGDKDGNPSSFFLIENNDWQVFGLDTSWELPTLGEAVAEDAWTVKDYAGQNGILTNEQIEWMKKERARGRDKGCILLTHHQPASSRTSEKQHANEAVDALVNAGLYDDIDAWIWGHEHRGVVFKPKAERKHPVLKDAPSFVCCLGHAGVPVTKKNFELDKTIPDVTWQEDRLGNDAPLYEKQRVVPFGFARLETNGPKFLFTVFDHDNTKRFQIVFKRGEGWKENFRAPSTSTTSGRSVSAKKPTRAAAKSAKKPAKPATKKTVKAPAKKTAKKAGAVAGKVVKQSAAKVTKKPVLKKLAKKKPAKKSARRR